MKLSHITKIFAMLLLLGCSEPQEQVRYTSREYSPNTSIIALIANPEAWHDKDVMTHGYAHFEFESDCIYFHETDYRLKLTKNALCLIVPDNLKSSISDYSDKYIWVRGTFDATLHGGLNSGGIKDIIGMGIHTLPDGSYPTDPKDYFIKKQ